MPVASIDHKLKSYYEDYYGEGELEAWRRLSSLDKVKNIVSLCNAIPHKRIVEVGCGDGAVLKRLSELQFGNSLYGLEIAQSAVQRVIQKEIGSLTECRVFDGYNIPYGNDTFDLAILTHVVEHLEHPRKLLHEAGRVADYVFIEVPLEDHYRLKESYQFNKVGHINVYSFKTIRWLAQTCNFEVLQQIVNMPRYAVWRHLLGNKALFVYLPAKTAVRLMPNAATRLFTYHCAMLCKKN